MKLRSFILSIFLAALFLFLVFWISGIQVSDIVKLVRNSQLFYILAAFVAYSGSYCGRAVRFKILLQNESPSLTSLISVVSLHNILNMVLPARTGELSYIYLLRSRFSLSSATGVATLISARVLDLLCLMLFFVIGLICFGSSIESSFVGLILTCVIAICISLVIILRLPMLSGAVLNLVEKCAKAFRIHEKGFVRKLLNKGAETVTCFQQIRSRKVLISAFLASCATWFCTFLTCYLVLLSFNVVSSSELSFGLSIVGTTALNASCILPINSFGNLGTWEAAWAAGYILIGMDETLAVETGFGEHIYIFLFALILAGIGWLGIPKKKSNTKNL